MAICIQCRKRANRRHACFYCGRGPICLRCVCPCRTTEEKQAAVAAVLEYLDAKAESEEP